MIDKSQVIERLVQHRDQLEQFSVKRLMLFGSVAKSTSHGASDVDLLVEFQRPVGLLTFIGLKDYLEEILGCAVDLGTPDSLKPWLKETVMKEAIRAF